MPERHVCVSGNERGCVCRSESAKFTAFACASVYARVHKLVNAPRHLLKEPVGSWFPARPEVLTRSPNDPRRRRQSCSDPPCAFVFRPRSAPAAARLLARCWASPKSPGRGAVLPGAGREGRRSLAGTPARRPRGLVAEPAVPAMATTRRSQPPLQLRFATGQYASGKAWDSGCVFLRAARVGKAGWAHSLINPATPTGPPPLTRRGRYRETQSLLRGNKTCPQWNMS